MTINQPTISSIYYYKENKNIKWIVLVSSILISISTILVTNTLVNQLKEREHNQVKLYTKALEYMINNESSDEFLFITEEIVLKNNSIPTILTGHDNSIISYINLEIDPDWSLKKKNRFLKRELDIMSKEYPPIDVKLKGTIKNEERVVQRVYYKNSSLLSKLKIIPFVEMIILILFGSIAYVSFNHYKVSEQNRVWVGLAKETAHQIGTPLSSLMAWVEVLREGKELKNKSLVEELDKDVNKLKIVTERFSSIGSAPVLKKENIFRLTNNIVYYLRSRISTKVNIELYALSENIFANINIPLFEWVIENLCKNAVDAMRNSGTISIKILRGEGGKVFIDVSDTGSGISKKIIQNIFNPGFTTKKRGWGLGLALVKRIIETYHLGKIFVKISEENKGTTFRIELKSA